ncbi:MAG TPA: DUF2254 domain-containing protein [Terrabacter sp.]|nr:DUF2254 domain-containing protein [Terrabacter sp.]
MQVTLPLQRLRLWWENAFWVIPLVGIVLGFATSRAVQGIDATIGSAEQRLLSASSAQTLLAAIGGGMVTFTGFVFSVILLVIQFGSSAYSPRTVTYLMRARSIQWVLATFLATTTFSFMTLIGIGSAGQASTVPVLGVAAAVLWLVLSLIGFLVLITVVSRRVTVDSLIGTMGSLARRQLRRHHTAARGRAGRRVREVPDLADEARTVRYAGRPGQVVGVDAERLERLARQHGAHLQVLVRVGDPVSVGAAVALLAPRSGTPLPDRELSRCLLVRHERSLKHDPLYALRILTDISLKALSPGINDPTTAARSLAEVEGVLRVAAELPLGPVVVDAGAGKVVLPAATWSDVVDQALLEVLEAGIGQPQVTRCLSRMLTDLLADVPPDQQAPLLRHQRRLRHDIRTAHLLEQPVWLDGEGRGRGGR